jgi:transposase-like protein
VAQVISERKVQGGLRRVLQTQAKRLQWLAERLVRRLLHAAGYRYRLHVKDLPGKPDIVFPQTLVQTCIVHLIRNSLSFVTWKDRKAILPSIKAIHRAENADMALVRLEEFEAEWGKRYPAIGQAWRRAWEHVIPFFAFRAGHPQNDLHHQRGGGAEPVATQDHQDPWQLSQR